MDNERFPVPENQNPTQQICISPEAWGSSNLAHMSWNQRLFISNSLSTPAVRTVSLAQFPWRGANMRDNRQAVKFLREYIMRSISELDTTILRLLCGL